MADGGVAGQCLGVMNRSLIGAADHRALDAAVLVTQGDLQVEDFLAVALETEMAGFDDAGVDRADGDFVNLVAVDAIEIHDPDDGRLGGRSAQRHDRRQGVWKRTGLNQGWPSGTMPYCSAISRSKRWTCGQCGVRDSKRSRSDVVAGIARRFSSSARTSIDVTAVARLRPAEQYGDALPARDARQWPVEIFKGKFGDVGQFNGLAVGDGGQMIGDHGDTFRNASHYGASDKRRGNAQAQQQHEGEGDDDRAAGQPAVAIGGAASAAAGGPERYGQNRAAHAHEYHQQKNRNSAGDDETTGVKAPLRIVNSLTNGPNGGEPVMARNPSRTLFRRTAVGGWRREPRR